MMDSNLIHPELRAMTSRIPSVPVGKPWLPKIASAAFRIAPAAKGPAGVTREWHSFGPGRGIYVYRPERPNGAALLWIHGGGMVIGSAKQDLGRMAKLAAELGIVVACVEYRLAPANPYPLPLDDCHEAWTWLRVSSARLGVDRNRISIGGQSAGGGLTAGLTQRLHDEGGIQPIAQWLFCPMLDDRTATDRSLDAIKHPVWNNTSNFDGWSAYIGTPGSDDVPEYAAPSRRADLSGLAPAWVGTGTVELFYAENVEYARRLEAAGVRTVFDEVDGAPHAFESMVANAPVSQAYMARAKAWLAAQLGLAAA